MFDVLTEGTIISCHQVFDNPWYIVEYIISTPDIPVKHVFTTQDKSQIKKKGDTIKLKLNKLFWEVKEL